MLSETIDDEEEYWVRVRRVADALPPGDWLRQDLADLIAGRLSSDHWTAIARTAAGRGTLHWRRKALALQMLSASGDWNYGHAISVLQRAACVSRGIDLARTTARAIGYDLVAAFIAWFVASGALVTYQVGNGAAHPVGMSLRFALSAAVVVLAPSLWASFQVDAKIAAHIRCCAITSLGRLGGSRSIGLLLAAASSKQPRVRETALAALVSVLGRAHPADVDGLDGQSVNAISRLAGHVDADTLHCLLGALAVAQQGNSLPELQRQMRVCSPLDRPLFASTIATIEARRRGRNERDTLLRGSAADVAGPLLRAVAAPAPDPELLLRPSARSD